MKKFLAAILIAGNLFAASPADAEVKTCEGSEEYLMSEFETIDIAKQRASQKFEDCRKLYYNGDYQGVVKLCNEAIKINANNAKAYALRGAIYREMKNFNAAISDLNKAVELNPKFAFAYYCRGLFWQATGNSTQAQADFAKVQELTADT